MKRIKLRSWPEIGPDGDVLLAPYVPKGITGEDDDDGMFRALLTHIQEALQKRNSVYCVRVMSGLE
jgi:hypothetical protein